MSDFKPGDEVEKFQDFGPDPKSDLPAPPIGHRGIVTATGPGWLEIDMWPTSKRWGLNAEEWRKVQRSLTDIRSWVEQPTDFEEPKLPARERKRERT